MARESSVSERRS